MGLANVLTVPGRFDHIRAIAQFVTAGAEAAGLDADAVFHVELCCDEAAANIIEHAYGGEDNGDIHVRYSSDERAFTVVLCDNGRPFNPQNIPEPKSVQADADEPEPALRDYLDSLQVGGLGIYFMRKLMDEVHYSFDEAEGNKLTLVKYLHTEPAS
ncbi:MAG: ATP-binding protein [Candidatus Promineifilaceae bacterium]